MPRLYRGVGLAGSVLLASAVAVHAEDALPQAAAPAQSAPSGCSGIWCVFTPRRAAGSETATRQASQAPQRDDAAAQPAVAASAEPVHDEAKSRIRAARPAHRITIAADSSEIARLKALALVLAKEKIKVVRARDKAGADFAVSTALDSPDRAGKAKLFMEQMHIVAGGDIRSVADLKDKVVSFAADRGTSPAAREAFKALNISVKETPLDLDNALDGLATGDIDAVVVLAPQPDEKLERVTAPGLHLVSWPRTGPLPSWAAESTIDGAHYPGLAKPGETIRALGVEAILTFGPNGARQPAAKTFLRALSQHSALLSKRGFELLKADVETGRRLASVDKR